jgi:hypothetical protein
MSLSTGAGHVMNEIRSLQFRLRINDLLKEPVNQCSTMQQSEARL